MGIGRKWKILWQKGKVHNGGKIYAQYVKYITNLIGLIRG